VRSPDPFGDGTDPGCAPAEAGTVGGLATVLYTAKKSGPKGAVDVTVQADGEIVSGSVLVVPPGQGSQ